MTESPEEFVLALKAEGEKFFDERPDLDKSADLDAVVIAWLSERIRKRDRAAREEAAARFSAALALVDRYAGCGDNSCLFSKPTQRGIGTNGGCRCIEPHGGGDKARLLVAALANLVRVVRTTAG